MKECPPDTLVTLREYLDSQLKAIDKATQLNNETINIRFISIEKATTLAANSMEKRLEGMNEFRDQLRDQASKFTTREEVSLKMETQDSKIEGIQRPVWIGIGMVIVMNALLDIILWFLKK